MQEKKYFETYIKKHKFISENAILSEIDLADVVIEHLLSKKIQEGLLTEMGFQKLNMNKQLKISVNHKRAL